MQITEYSRETIRLGRALYCTYAHHSLGKDRHGAPMPSWSEIQLAEHEANGTYKDRRDQPLGDGVLSHWLHVASSVTAAGQGPDIGASGIAQGLEAQHKDSETFLRCAS